MKKILKNMLVLFIVLFIILLVYLKTIPIGLREKSKNLLTDFFDLQFKRDHVNTYNFVNNPKLAELYNLKFNSLIVHNKNKRNINVNVNVNSITRKKLHSYIVKFEVINTFNYIGRDKKSEAIDYYTCEIQNVDNRLYINKLVDDACYDNYIEKIDSNFISKELSKYILPFDNYLNEEIENIKDFQYRNKIKKLIFKN